MKRVSKVVNNNDPKKMGRVQIRVKNKHDGVSDEDLPWASAPQGSNGGGSVNVPKVGDEIYVDMEGNEPSYYGSVTGSSRLDPQLQDNYPHRKGFSTESGLVGYVDTNTNKISINTPSGLELTVEPSGNIIVNGTAKLNLTAAGDIVITAPNVKIEGNVEIDGNLEVKGTSTLLQTKINGIDQVGS